MLNESKIRITVIKPDTLAWFYVGGEENMNILMKNMFLEMMTIKANYEKRRDDGNPLKLHVKAQVIFFYCV